MCVIYIDSTRHPPVEMSGVPGFLLLPGLDNSKPVRHWAPGEALFRVMKGEVDGEREERGWGKKGKREEGREGEEIKTSKHSLARSGYRVWPVSQAVKTQKTAHGKPVS